MNGKDKLAGKYAQAFVNLYAEKITEEQFFNIMQAHDILSEDNDILLLLEFPFVKEDKKKFIDKFLKKFSLIKEFSGLLNMLIDSHRIVLFVEILEFILWEFQDHTKKIYFDIAASDELSKSEIEIIKRFLMKLSNSDIIYKYSIDKKLIAGLRALSSNFLWQYSVSAKLQKVKRALLEESL